MMRKNSGSAELQEWVSSILKGGTVAVLSLLAFFAQQINSTMKELTVAIRAIEIRVTAIEVSREANMTAYQRLIVNVQEMQNQITQLSILISKRSK